VSVTGNDFLHRQLIRLGDMIGDGQADEPGGAWIKREYKQTMRALGISPPRRNRSAQIDERMRQRVAEVKCPTCAGELKQTRSGSTRAKCGACGALLQLLKLK
jgi:ribosomal protein S27E